ncbi:MAG: threonine--tRNA ligase [Deltaproteobacteria bacterium]|jgi:threonyl-tRNA synthetase|nr:threonine--tRNA ligase [Deltaproteobacteria bacterium]
MSFNIKEDQELSKLNHSCAHLLAQAVKNLFPQAKFWVGPVIEDGFYYDIDLDEDAVSEENLKTIEDEMRKCAKSGAKIIREELSRAEAIQKFKDDPYKIDLIENLPENETISCYSQGDFTDLCRGPHVENVGLLKHFKLLKVSGAYWKGDAGNKMLQRIYGICFLKKEDLDEYLRILEEAKKRDHRKIGRELELFMFDDTAPGMPYWLNKGLKIYNALVDFWRAEHEKHGYQEFAAPLLNSSALWKTSGHWEHYKEDMFVLEDVDGNAQALKPMSCPNAILIYKNKIRSYRDLPLRLNDVDGIHRNERAAALHGLLRVRFFHQDDSHNFIRQDQIFDELSSILDLANYLYEIFGLTFTPHLSTRPADFMGEISKWNEAEEKLKQVLDEKFPDKWVLNPGDGAFYGPKIDLIMEDSLKRKWQMGTIQLDYQLPERFDLVFTNSSGEREQPIIVHRTIYGSLERFIGILLEHFAGALPLWLSPVQVIVVPVNNEKHLEYAKLVLEKLKAQNIRVELDDRNEKLGYKMRASQTSKIPYTLILGDKEINENIVSYRQYGKQETVTVAQDEFGLILETLIRLKSTPSISFSKPA